MTITIGSLTGGEIKGDGNFDELMRTVKSNLQEQYDSGRINSSDFANVYLGALVQVLQTSQQFTLSEEQANLGNEMLQAQIIGQDLQNQMLTAQIAKTEADTAIAVKQLEVMSAQLLQLTEQTELITKQQDKIDKELEVADTQIDLNTSQNAQVVANTALTGQKLTNAVTENSILLGQVEKLTADTALAAQKVITETAQTIDTPEYNPETQSGGGILGRQMGMFEGQRDGYARDAEQKLTKIMTDTWTVRQTTDGADAGPAGLSDADINDVLKIAKKGIGDI